MYREKVDFKFGNISRKGQTDIANSDTLRMTKVGGGVVRVHTHFLWKKEKLFIRPTPESGKASLAIRSFKRPDTDSANELRRTIGRHNA